MLVAGNQSVLDEILRVKGALVEHALRGRFAGVLNETDLEDAISVALFRLWTYRNKFDSRRSSVGAWFYLLARNAAIDILRVQSRQRELTNERQLLERVTQEVKPACHDKGADQHTHSVYHSYTPAYNAIRDAIEKLDEIDRRIVMAFIYRNEDEDWTDGIAEELGLSRNAIRIRNSRTLKKVRRQLEAVDVQTPFSTIRMEHDMEEE